MENGRASKKLLVEDDEEDVNLELAVNTEYASRFEVCSTQSYYDLIRCSCLVLEEEKGIWGCLSPASVHLVLQVHIDE